jgi:prepilin-type processing-associated H-X9-DG protein/prepilin-type N-terminal cleavage/methylation domain-containing protein
MMYRRGFSLVELLVVIGILGVLISLLLPALSRVRQQGDAIKCASNLRQIGVGWVMYANAHRGTSVPGRMPNLGAAFNVYSVGNGEAWRPRWFVTLGQQTGIHAYTNPSPLAADDNTKAVDNPVFHCPAVPERVNNRNYTFGYNFQFLGNTRNKVGTPSGVFNPINFPVRISKINGSETVLATDAMGTAAGKRRDQRTGYRADGSADLFAVGNHAWSLDPPRLTARSDTCDDSNRGPQHRSAPDERHKGKANVLFCDGHVELMMLKELGYVTLPDGTVTASGAGATNRLFSGNGTDRDPPNVD